MIRQKLLSLCFAIGCFAIGAAGIAAAGADSSRTASRLTGVWLTQVTIRHCTTDDILAGPFPGLISYHAGGTVSEIGPSLPTTTRSPAHGVWRRTGPHSFVVDIIFQRYDLNGFFIGTQTIRGEPVIDVTTGTYVAKGAFTLQDAAGAQVGAGCSQVNGRRFDQD
jgi:hypothetical protein